MPSNSICGTGATLTATQPASCRAAIPLPVSTMASTAISAELAEKNVPIGSRRLVRSSTQAISPSTAAPAAMPAP